MKPLIIALGFLGCTSAALAQKNAKEYTVEIREKGDTATTVVTVPVDSTGKKKIVKISIGSNGIEISKKERGTPGAAVTVDNDSAESKPPKALKLQWGMVDLGFNRLDDKTTYTNSPEMMAFLGYDPTQPGSPNAFRLREGKSINVNVWPLMARLRLHDGKHQRFYFTTGIGLQMYNFRFESNKMITDEPTPRITDIKPGLHVQKNKLGLTYLSIPVSILAKTKVADKWLVYGVGVTGGYRIASWTKLKSSEEGKQKNHDAFNFNDFNACVTGEVGLDNYLRLYASYQLTPLHKDVLDQHPFCIGVRFLGL
jgi:hypothetical protein